jgi:hypothetical protein
MSELIEVAPPSDPEKRNLKKDIWKGINIFAATAIGIGFLFIQHTFNGDNEGFSFGSIEETLYVYLLIVPFIALQVALLILSGADKKPANVAITRAMIATTVLLASFVPILMVTADLKEMTARADATFIAYGKMDKLINVQRTSPDKFEEEAFLIRLDLVLDMFQRNGWTQERIDKRRQQSMQEWRRHHPEAAPEAK